MIFLFQMMKKFIITGAAVLALFGFLMTHTSCQKEYNASTKDDTTTFRNPLQGDFTCIIGGGAMYVADIKSYADTGNVLTISTQQFSPNKSERVNKNISLTILNYDGPKTYKIHDGNALGTYIDVDSYETQTYTSIDVDTFSSITITNNGDKLEGSFFFTVRPVGGNPADSADIQITTGEFSIPKN